MNEVVLGGVPVMVQLGTDGGEMVCDDVMGSRWCLLGCEMAFVMDCATIDVL